MRIVAGAAVLMAALSCPAWAGGADDYCPIPKLEPGVATTVAVSHIDKPFCGTALINKSYVRMAEFAKATEISAPQCSSESFCTKVFRFYQDEGKTSTPYILIFYGPKLPHQAG